MRLSALSICRSSGRGLIAAQLDGEKAAVRELHAFGKLAIRAHLVDQAREQTGMAAVFAHFTLKAIDFLDHDDRDDDVVISEFKEGLGIKEEDVGVEDEGFSQRDSVISMT